VLVPFQRDSGYVEKAWFWRHIDMAVVVGLNALDVLLPLPPTSSQLTMKLALTLFLLVSLLTCLFLLPNPYVLRWQWYLRVSLVLLSASCVVVNGATRSLDIGEGGPALEAIIAPLSYANMCVLFITVVVLLAGFAIGLHRTTQAKGRSYSQPCTSTRSRSRSSRLRHV